MQYNINISLTKILFQLILFTQIHCNKICVCIGNLKLHFNRFPCFDSIGWEYVFNTLCIIRSSSRVHCTVHNCVVRTLYTRDLDINKGEREEHQYVAITAGFSTLAGRSKNHQRTFHLRLLCLLRNIEKHSNNWFVQYWINKRLHDYL